MIKMTDAEFAELTGYLKANFGINLTKKRVLIEGRMNNYLLKNGFEDYGSYFRMLFADKSGAEMSNVINFLTTNYSYFMREWDHFECYKNVMLPFIRKVGRGDLRVWSAGCSTGEEPYTLAMLTDDFFALERGRWDTKILATDISANVLAHARQGIYDATSVEKIPGAWKNRYFDRLDEDRFQIKQSLREEIIFRHFNLMEKKLPFKKPFHVIFCRNVMIYFDAPTKRALIERYYNALAPGGFLVVGQSEAVERGMLPFGHVMPSVYRKDGT